MLKSEEADLLVPIWIMQASIREQKNALRSRHRISIVLVIVLQYDGFPSWKIRTVISPLQQGSPGLTFSLSWHKSSWAATQIAALESLTAWLSRDSADIHFTSKCTVFWAPQPFLKYLECLDRRRLLAANFEKNNLWKMCKNYLVQLLLDARPVDIVVLQAHPSTSQRWSTRQHHASNCNVAMEFKTNLKPRVKSNSVGILYKTTLVFTHFPRHQVFTHFFNDSSHAQRTKVATLGHDSRSFGPRTSCLVKGAFKT